MVLKKYRFPIIMLVITIGLYIYSAELGKKAVEITFGSILEMFSILPLVFVLLGLLDVWVKKEVMIKYLGQHSGILGVIISFVLGSVAAGPLYGAFPIAAVLMKKGAKFSNILIFIGAWSTTKVPMFMFEITSLGPRFAITRLLVDIIGIIVIAFVIDKLVHQDVKDSIYEQAENIS